MKLCKRCGTPVSFDEVSDGYYAVCPQHDEDLYEFETTTMKDQIKKYIHLLNDGSDNNEYLRGQVELAMNLLGYSTDTQDALREELTNVAQGVK